MDEQRRVDLEEKVLFLERSVEELTEVANDQARELELLRARLERLEKGGTDETGSGGKREGP